MAAETIDEAIVQILTADGGVSAIVGQKVSLGNIPQVDQVPAIWFRQLSVQDDETFESQGLGLERAVFEFTCEGSDRLSSARLAKALMACLGGYRATVGNVRIDGTRRITQIGAPDAVNQRYTIAAAYQFAVNYL